jgi:hypothetical protein
VIGMGGVIGTMTDITMVSGGVGAMELGGGMGGN